MVRDGYDDCLATRSPTRDFSAADRNPARCSKRLTGHHPTVPSRTTFASQIQRLRIEEAEAAIAPFCKPQKAVPAIRPMRSPEHPPALAAVQPNIAESADLLERHGQRMSNASEGNRNNTLHDGAYALAASGRYDKNMVKPLLVRAAKQVGLGPTEINATFNRGWADGEKACGKGTLGTDRLSRTQLSNLVWASELCPNHRLLMLGVISFMNGEGEAWPSYDALAERIRMGRSTVVTLMKGLDKAKWLIKRTGPVEGKAGWVSNLYQTPLQERDPKTPEHCQQPRGRTANLRKGGVVKRPEAGAEADNGWSR